MLIVRSPVRISLAGGGTDLPAYYRAHGGAVLHAAINKYFYSVLCGRGDGKVQIISSDLRVMEGWDDLAHAEVRNSRLEIPLAVLQHFGRPASFDLFLASEILPGTGLGSSAAVCVNVLTALSRHFGLSMSKYQLAESAYHIAREVLHKPVGKQDEYASAFGGLNFVQFHPDDSVSVDPVLPTGSILRDLEGRLMLFFTGASHDSWTILKSQERASSEKSGTAVESLHFIKDLAFRMHRRLEQGDLDAIGSLLHEGWEAKKNLSAEISNGRIDRFYAAARAAGSSGGKITGAGGGGFMLLYAAPERQAAVRSAMLAEGLQELTFRFDPVGAHVVTHDPFLDEGRHGGLKWCFTPMNENPALVSY